MYEFNLIMQLSKTDGYLDNVYYHIFTKWVLFHFLCLLHLQRFYLILTYVTKLMNTELFVLKLVQQKFESTVYICEIISETASPQRRKPVNYYETLAYFVEKQKWRNPSLQKQQPFGGALSAIRSRKF